MHEMVKLRRFNILILTLIVLTSAIASVPFCFEYHSEIHFRICEATNVFCHFLGAAKCCSAPKEL